MPENTTRAEAMREELYRIYREIDLMRADDDPDDDLVVSFAVGERLEIIQAAIYRVLGKPKDLA